MAEQKTTQHAREQFKVAENTAQNMLRVWNDMLFTTTDWSFDMAERSLRYNQELRSQSERTLNEALASYRGLYYDGLKTWQGYVQGINDIISRSL
jgi:cytoplasmic iron level regulating protein YaaA (DUF328/UPF0246 family)